LSDKSEQVRKAALAALTRVYGLEGAEEEAVHFSQRFKGRMVQCCEDSSADVQAMAVALISALHGVGHVEATDVELALELLFASEANVSNAAGELFHKVRLYFPH